MTSLRRILAIAAVGVPTGVAVAESPETLLQGGAYEITYRLELPHLERWALNNTTTICVADAGEVPATLPIFSGNNPFANCSAENVRRDGANLTYSIICEGRDSARAYAAYKHTAGEFRGRIDMVMGAKNMTMTEVQVGRRLGRCDLASAIIDQR